MSNLVRMKIYLKKITLFYSMFLCLVCIFYACGSIAKQEEKLPNVIIIFTDDQGYNDLACFGSPDILTPNIDRIAENGTKFTNFHTAQPVCTASRVSLLTGCYPNRLGMHGALGPGAGVGIHDDEMTMAELFKQKDYATAIFGKWHLGVEEPFNPLHHGFDEYFGIPYSNDMWPLHPWQGSIFNFPDLPLYDGFSIVDTLLDQSNLTTQITERAVHFINENKDNPFFLYVPHPQPHVPLYVSDKFKGKSERGIYGDVIMEIDWSVGQMIKALEANNLTENTLVIYTSDNGPWLSYGTHSGSAFPLKEGKGTNWEGGTRVPCVMQFPGKIPAGKNCKTNFMTIDLLPTIASLIGGELPNHKIDGHNVWPLINGKSSENQKDTYAYYYHQNHLEAVYHEGWKLILPHKYRTLNGRSGTADGLPIDYEHTTLSKAELYQVSSDKEEKNNVFDQYPEKVAELNAIAELYRNDLGDALQEKEGTNLRAPGRINAD